MPVLEQEVRRCLNGESSGHDLWHAFRVRDLAIRIAQIIGADTEVVHAAALLHDIGHVSGRAEHAERGASLAADLLSSCAFPLGKILAVTSCIEQHHWLPGRAGDPKRPTLEYQAFADADRLDAVGAIGIARTFAFGGAHGRPIWEPEPNAGANGPYGISSIHHFHDKLLRLHGDMYTEPGRRVAARRIAVIEEFLRMFHLQWDGKDVELNALATEPRVSLGSLPKRSVKVGDRIRRIFAAILQPDPIN
ncbi:MAG TPA: HD domain-containing protein [Bryobacteraceae bacterium]|nr:HD domain-containing protein [Bryobacteraceae bacterium]